MKTSLFAGLFAASVLGGVLAQESHWSGRAILGRFEHDTSAAWKRSQNYTCVVERIFPKIISGVQFKFWDNGTYALSAGEITGLQLSLYVNQVPVFTNRAISVFTNTSQEARSGYIVVDNCPPMTSNTVYFFEIYCTNGSADSLFVYPEVDFAELQ